MPRWPDPPLADEAITLRPWRESDIPAQLAAFRDPVFQRHSDWAPLTEADALAALHTDSQVDLAIVADRVAGGVSLHSFVDGRAEQVLEFLPQHHVDLRQSYELPEIDKAGDAEAWVGDTARHNAGEVRELGINVEGDAV